MGGAVELGNPLGNDTVFITGTIFSGNQASDSGGAVYVRIANGAVDLTINQSTFSGNSNKGGKGGALDNICIAPGLVRAQVSQGTFTGNVAAEVGGAISDFACQTTIADSQFIGNSAASDVGGALEAQSVVTVTDSTFVSNTSRSAGGAVAVFGTLTMSGSQVIQNQAQNPSNASDFAPVGAGVLVSSTAVITNTQFVSNTPFLQGLFMTSNLAEGGGLAVQGVLRLAGGQFLGNSAEHGGGLYAQGSAPSTSALLQGNQAGLGGGVFADGSLALVNNRLVDNIALETLKNEPSLGGGLLLQNRLNPVLAINNLFLGNRALTADSSVPHGSAMSLGGLATAVGNNTIVARGLDSTGAASQVTGSLSFVNNIITSHTVAIEQLGGLFLFEDYNPFHGNTTNISATGVISSPGHSRVADPRFVAPGQDDFRLQLDSPAIDAGDNDLVPHFVTTDLDGAPRFADVPAVPDTGNGIPPIVDIGAFEFASHDLFLLLVTR